MTREDWDAVAGAQTPVGRIIVLEEVGSTQDEARLRTRGQDRCVVVAKRQMRGRGRLGRSWDDAHGASLSMSFPCESDLPAPGMAIAVGLGVFDACTSLGATGLGLKWPNDVVERSGVGFGRKLCGVLIEAVGGEKVVGVGLNVERMDGVAEAVGLEALGVTMPRTSVIGPVIDGIAARLSSSPAAIRDSWREVDVLRGQRCRFRVNGNPVVGIVHGLDAQWRLVLEVEGGRRVRVDAGFAQFEECTV